MLVFSKTCILECWVCVCVFFIFFLFSGDFLGEQIFEVLGIYVEPTVLGYGGCCYHGNSSCQWRGEYVMSQRFHFQCQLNDFVNYWTLPYTFNAQGKPPDWQDFVGIITLLLINSTISFIEENNAGNAAAALMARLDPKANVLYLHNCLSYPFHVSGLIDN